MDTPKALSRGLTLALLLAGIGIAFGGCAANSQFATFGLSGPSLPSAAVVALPPAPAPVDTAIDAPPKEKWVDKLHKDIHESKLRMEKWNEEVKSLMERHRKSAQGDQQAAGSGTASAVVAAAGGLTPARRPARGPCE